MNFIYEVKVGAWLQVSALRLERVRERAVNFNELDRELVSRMYGIKLIFMCNKFNLLQKFFYLTEMFFISGWIYGW